MRRTTLREILVLSTNDFCQILSLQCESEKNKMAWLKFYNLLKLSLVRKRSKRKGPKQNWQLFHKYRFFLPTEVPYFCRMPRFVKCVGFNVEFQLLQYNWIANNCNTLYWQLNRSTSYFYCHFNCFKIHGNYCQ